MINLIRRTKSTGWVTLIVAILLIALSTSLTTLMTQTAIVEQKLSANDYRIKQAYGAADAGIEHGLRYLIANSKTIQQDSNNDGYINAVNDNSLLNVTLPNSSQYSMNFSNPTVNNFNIISIQSVGLSNDGLSTKTITQEMLMTPFLQVSPPSGLIARKEVSLGGNMSVTNTNTDFTIWAGEEVDFSGSAETIISTGTGSDKNGLGPDVQDNDTTLDDLSASNFFEYFFSADESTIQNAAHLSFSNNSNTNYSNDLSGQTDKLIWIEQTSGEARINSNITIGSVAGPVILVVDGDLKINGSVTIYGVVYINQDWENTGGGSLTINGAAIVNGDFSGTGTPDIVFNQTVLGNVSSNLGSWSKIPGTWRDF